MTDKQLLLIAYYFPPMPSVASARMENIAGEAKKQFDKVHVFSTRNAMHFGPVQDPDIHNMPTLDYRSIALNQLKRSELHFGGKISTSKWKQWAGRLLSSWPLQYTLGEGGAMYIYNVIRKAEELIDEHPVTHILSSFSPMADHHIARRLKSRHPELKWIADFRDLLVDEFQQNLLFSDWHKKKYTRIFRAADECWSVSRGQAEILKTMISKEVKVVRNGLPERYPLNTIAYQTGTFRISYTGSLYQDYPYEEWVEALEQFQESCPEAEQAEFHYAGKDSVWLRSLMERAKWKGKWVDHGLVSKKTSWEIQQKSHLNLLFSWSHPKSRGVLTGKVYEYLAARRPVLALVKGEADKELEALIREFHGRGSQICHTSDCASGFLEQVYRLYAGGEQLDLLGEEEKLRDLYFKVNFND